LEFRTSRKSQGRFRPEPDQTFNFDYLFPFFRGPAERNHELDIRQAYLFAGLGKRTALMKTILKRWNRTMTSGLQSTMAFSGPM